MGLRGAKLALERPAEAWCLAAGVLRKSCLGWACGGRACWNKLGHGEGHGRDKPGSTPPVVPGAAPALAKAGVGGLTCIMPHTALPSTTSNDAKMMLGHLTDREVFWLGA